MLDVEILLPLSPYWFYLIDIGQKRREARMTEPSKGCPFKVFVYVTKDESSLSMIPASHRERYRRYMGTVAASFLVPKINTLTPSDLEAYAKDHFAKECKIHELISDACVPMSLLEEYARGRPVKLWQVTNWSPLLFKGSLKLWGVDFVPQSWIYL